MLQIVAAVRPAATAVFQSEQFRAAAVCAACACQFDYHRGLWKAETAGKPSWVSAQARIRANWARYVVRGGSTETFLYASETLKNAIHSTTVLASTMSGLFTLVIGLLLQAQQSLEAKARLAIVAMLLLCSAYEFLQSARLLTHVSFMFPIVNRNFAVEEEVDGKLTFGTVEQVMIRSEYTRETHGIRTHEATVLKTCMPSPHLGPIEPSARVSSSYGFG